MGASKSAIIRASPADRGCRFVAAVGHPDRRSGLPLYEVTDRPYRELYDTVSDWSAARRMEVVDVALHSRTRRDEMLRAFRGGPYVYDILMDIGAYRDMHRHRRCVQLRQEYTARSGYSVPEPHSAPGAGMSHVAAMDKVFALAAQLPYACCGLRTSVCD